MASWIDLALAVTRLGFELVSKLRPASSAALAPAQRPPVFGRKHAWGWGLATPPRCAYCGMQLDAQGKLRDAMCLGPPAS